MKKHFLNTIYVHVDIAGTQSCTERGSTDYKITDTLQTDAFL